MKKLDEAAAKQRRLNLAKETLKRDSKPTGVQLEKTMWKRKQAEADGALSPVAEDEAPMPELPAFPAEAEVPGSADLEGAALEALKDIAPAISGELA